MNHHDNHHALDTCAREYTGRFVSAARRVLLDEPTAEDAVQDAMVSAARSLHRFRGDSQLSTWVGRIVINSALSRRRAIRRRREEPVLALTTDEPSPEQIVWQSELRSLIRQAIDDLPADCRAVIILRHFHEASVADIAAQLGSTSNAIKIRLHRARRMLQRLLVERGCSTILGWASGE